MLVIVFLPKAISLAETVTNAELDILRYVKISGYWE
jgi:hypothetical protein